jgi:CDP-diacylglycerol--glycerol-3-phosphate 3-phosphatidyltransferase
VNEKKYNIPNIISVCRIASVPVMIWCIFTNKETLFTWLLAGALISDILDGVIARIFNMITKLGSFLDSLGDMGTYISAVAGIFVFKMDFIRNYWPAISAIVGMYILEKVFSFLRYKKLFNAFHTYLSKITAYAQGAFAVSLFVFGFKWYLFYPAMALGILANIEEMILSRLLQNYENDVKGLFWVLQKKKRQHETSGYN